MMLDRALVTWTAFSALPEVNSHTNWQYAQYITIRVNMERVFEVTVFADSTSCSVRDFIWKWTHEAELHTSGTRLLGMSKECVGCWTSECVDVIYFGLLLMIISVW